MDLLVVKMSWLMLSMTTGMSEGLWGESVSSCSFRALFFGLVLKCLL